MVSEGPTTTGSINAKIGATNRDLVEAVAESKALVKDLTDTPTNVKVGANVSEAITKLSAVEAAQQKLGLATDRLKLAYQRLDEIQSAGTAKQSTLMAAHLAAARAEKAHEDATRNLTAAQAAETAATDAETAATGRSNDGQKRRMAYWQVIAAVIAGLIPLMGPLAGYAAGVAGSLGAMGAAGVLAVLGIKKAMEDGTRQGDQYAAGLQVLKGDLNELSNTAATSMLLSYYLAIGQINASMPTLNSETRIFSQQLGTAGNLLLGGLLTGLRVAKPLLIDAGVYVQQLAAGFLSWTKNGGLSQFVQYAISMLPRVAAALGQLAQLLVRVIEASSPIGTVVLAAIQGIATAINAIPIPILTALITTIGGTFVAFKLWQVVPTIISGVQAAIAALGAVMDLSLGPIGLLATVIGVLGATVGLTVLSMQTATQAQVDYTAAVQQDNGVVGKNVELQVAKNLAQIGGYQTAQRLGVSQKELTDAVLNGGTAYKEIKAKIDAAAKSADSANAAYRQASEGQTEAGRSAQKWADDLRDLQTTFTGSRTSIQDQIKVYNELQTAIGGTTISTKEQLRAEMDNAAQYGLSLSAYENARAAQKQNQQQADATTAAMQQEGDAAGLLRNAFDLLNKGSLDVAQAQTGVASATNSLTDSFKQNGLIIDGNTKQAVANQQAVQRQVESAQDYAQAIADQTKSSAQGKQAYADRLQETENQLQAQGLLTDAVKTYLENLYDVNDFNPKLATFDVDTAQAMKKLSDLKAYLESFNQATQMRIDLGITNAPGQVIRRAGGGTIADGPSGTVFGPGSPTSDSILTRLSRGEEVLNASSANYPGVRSLTKSLDRDPAGTMAALSTQPAPRKTVVHNWYITQAVNPNAVYAEVQRRENLVAQ